MQSRLAVKARVIAVATVSAAVLFSAAPYAMAQIKGMPGLDATKPIGQPDKPKTAVATGDLRPPSFTEAQAQRGRRSYVDHCSDCHGSNLNNGEFGGAPLKGTYFNDHWGALTVDALYGFIDTAMPPNRPGSLNPQTYTDIITFLLSKNGYRPTGNEMPADTDRMATMTLEKK